MSEHNCDCDELVDVITMLFTDCRAQFITNGTMRVLLRKYPCCNHCLQLYQQAQSSMTGRLYKERLGAIIDEVNNSGSNVIDMFDGRT